MPTFFPITQNIWHKYDGCGLAVAAVAGGEIIDFVYLRSVFPDIDESDGDQIEAAIRDANIGPAVRELSAVGEVVIGVCSAYEVIVS